MSDPRNALKNMFKEENRYANFGEVIINMHASGFRCHSNTPLEIASPITALCGLNGTGKSTLLQLAAAAYRCSPQYYIKDFIVISSLDPQPFTHDAAVTYSFWQQDTSRRRFRISRKDDSKRWRGYRSRKEKSVLFLGVGHYVPRVEQHDFIVRYAKSLTVGQQQAVSARIKDWTCRILGRSYDNMLNCMVTYSSKSGEVIVLERNNNSYSETNAGYGEGRTAFLVSRLELLPEKSLVLIEEPETSLHPSAQHRLGQYFVDVAQQKKHQIFLTTHSEELLSALPLASIKYLHANQADIHVIDGITPSQARSLMSDGHATALHVLVEDSCAQAILREIVRRIDATFLQTIRICVGGDKDAIARTVRGLSNTGLRVAAVRDADKEGCPRENIFKLPGTDAPEKELMACAAVKTSVANRHGLILDDFVSTLSDANHHDWWKKVAEQVHLEENGLVCEIARAYVESLPESEIDILVSQLKDASNT